MQVYGCHLFLILICSDWLMHYYCTDTTVSSFIGALLLPCTMCLATRQGLKEEKGREATMEASDLEEIPTKFRQHLWRHHGKRARDEEAQCMISFAKILLCPHLHERRPEVVICSYLHFTMSSLLRLSPLPLTLSHLPCHCKSILSLLQSNICLVSL